jgi:hypothetical protein
MLAAEVRPRNVAVAQSVDAQSTRRGYVVWRTIASIGSREAHLTLGRPGREVARRTPQGGDQQFLPPVESSWPLLAPAVPHVILASGWSRGSGRAQARVGPDEEAGWGREARPPGPELLRSPSTCALRAPMGSTTARRGGDHARHASCFIRLPADGEHQGGTTTSLDGGRTGGARGRRGLQRDLTRECQVV